MNTTMTIGQLRAILDLAEQKGVVPDRMTLILASGILADLLDEEADLTNREAVRNGLKLGSLETDRKLAARGTINLPSRTEPLDLANYF